MTPDDPRQIIGSFLTLLPATIQREVLFQVLAFAFKINARKSPPDKFSELALNHLQRDGIEGISAVICVTAVVDHVLEGMVSNRHVGEAVANAMEAKEPENLAIKKWSASIPLSKKHLEQTVNEWRHLRATKLTPGRLQDFASALLLGRQP